tara:strand:- start:104 stop:421 length:318 start_codon:yes stop_codon:yes gene_type:complete
MVLILWNLIFDNLMISFNEEKIKSFAFTVKKIIRPQKKVPDEIVVKYIPKPSRKKFISSFLYNLFVLCKIIIESPNKPKANLPFIKKIKIKGIRDVINIQVLEFE